MPQASFLDSIPPTPMPSDPQFGDDVAAVLVPLMAVPLAERIKARRARLNPVIKPPVVDPKSVADPGSGVDGPVFDAPRPR